MLENPFKNSKSKIIFCFHGLIENFKSSINYMTPLDKVILFKLILATFLGLLIGLERKLSHKTAGMRTFALISLGSALFVILSNDVIALFDKSNGFDPSRVLSQIVVGLGFLGAGLIIFTEKEKRVHGLTTAASIWVAAGIGSASNRIKKLSRYLKAISIIGGIFLVVLGVLLLTGKMNLWIGYFFQLLQFTGYDKLIKVLEEN